MINSEVIKAGLAGATIIIFAAVLFIYMLYPLPAASENVLMFLFGVLSSNYNQIYQYFFGSSQGAKDKDDAIIAANIVEAKKVS